MSFLNPRFSAAIILLLPVLPLNAHEWACIQHDAQHTGRTSRVVFQSEPFVSWEAETGGSLFGSPIIDDGNDHLIVVPAGNENQVVAFKSWGEQAWAFDTNGEVFGSPAFATDGSIYAADMEGYVYKITASGTSTLSYRNTSDPLAEKRFLADVTPGTGGYVFVADWMERIRRVKDGASSMNFDMNQWAIAPVTVSSDGAYAYYPNRPSWNRFEIVKVNTSTGAQAGLYSDTESFGGWGGEQASGICLDEANGRMYVSADFNVSSGGQGSMLHAVNVSSMSAAWNAVNLGAGSYAIPALSPDGSRIYVTLLDGRVKAINTSNGQTVWTYDSGAEMIRGSAVVDGDGKILFADMNGVVHCLDENGDVVWQYTQSDDTIASSLAIMDNGDIIVGTANGFVRRLAPAPLEIPYGNATVTIDGQFDPGEWDDALVIPVEGLTPSANPGWNPLDGDVVQLDDCSFDLYLMHDGSSLYVALDVTDDDVSSDFQAAQPDHCNVWNDDCTEVLIDGDFDKDFTEGAWSSPVGDRDWREGSQTHFGVLDQHYWDNNKGTKDSAFWAETGLTETGYITEYRFTFQGIDTADGEGSFQAIVPGDIFGINAIANDDDNGGDREDQVSLNGGDHENTLYNTQGDWVPATLLVDPPAPTTPDLLADDDTGPMNDDDVTNKTQVTLTGHSVPGGTVTIRQGDTDLASGTVAADGTYSILVDVAEGLQEFYAQAVDRYALESGSSSFLEILVDTTPPQVTVNPATVDVPFPTLTGMVSDSNGATVEVTFGGQVIQAVVDGDSWTATATVPLTDGTYEVEAVATDLAGNQTTDSTSDELTVEGVGTSFVLGWMSY